MFKPPKWLWFLDITIGITFISGISSFFVWRRSENFRRETFSRVPLISDYFYHAEDVISGQLKGTRMKRKDYSNWFPEQDNRE
ncbi:unnamed protein product [Thelazia callipaeda]|uniref:DUF3592 domain-containing protein n=1 Tax=Thelazia callipaeda TaxID=103827 RepID=A0A0N5CMI0_THECL|nr:unnamed protein product [Thelazia callipaeda]